MFRIFLIVIFSVSLNLETPIFCQDSAIIYISKFDLIFENNYKQEINDSISKTKTYYSIFGMDTLFYNNNSNNFFVKRKDQIIINGTFEYNKCNHKLSLNGIYVEKYSNGNVKSIGNFLCNDKNGMWTYFYENGKIWKIENYRYSFSNTNNFKILTSDEAKNRRFLLSDQYLEYYDNGNLKILGNYKITMSKIKSLHHTIYDPKKFNISTTISNGIFQMPTSLKTGKWLYFDENGSIIKWDFY